MKIYVQSAGSDEWNDYAWKGDFSAAAKSVDANPPISWHWHLKEGDRALALLAGYAGGTWHVEYRNLILPGVTDFRGRQIVQNIIFSGLQSSDEVRALVHAYLDIELRFKTSGRPEGRVCPELAACYSATDDGDFAFDCRKAEAWAQKVIDAYKPDALREATLQRITGNLNPANEDEVQQLRELINTLELEESNGLQIAFSQVSIVREPTLRLNLTYTNITGALTCEELRRRKKQPTPTRTTNAPKPSAAQTLAKDEAKKIEDKAKENLVKISKPTKKADNNFIGKTIFVIVMLLVVGGLSTYIFYHFSTKNDKHSAVKTTPPAPSTTHPKKGEKNQDKKQATAGVVSEEQNTDKDTPAADSPGKVENN